MVIRELTEEDGSTFCISCGLKLRVGNLAWPTDYPEFFTCPNDECMEIGNARVRQAMGIYPTIS